MNSELDIQMYKDDFGEYRFKMRSKDGKLIAVSPGSYQNEDDCKRAIKTIMSDTTECCQQC